MAWALAALGLVAAAFQLAPQLTRADIFFGTTVAPDFRGSPTARAVARRYAAEIWLMAAAAAVFVVSAPMPLVTGPMLLAQTAGASVAYVRARRSVRPHAIVPAAVREAELGPRPDLPGGIIGQLGPLVILVAAAVYVALHWDHVPARFPTHWNLAGMPDGWTRKSVAGVFRALMLGVVVNAMMAFTSYSILHRSRLPRVTGAAGAQDRRVRHINLIAILATEYLIALLIAWTSVVSMFADAASQRRLPLAFRIAPFALVIVGALAIRVVRRVAIADGVPVGDTTPDACWYFGQLYINRGDPALFVEKRMGPGYTLNLGNPTAWLVTVVFGGAILVLLLIGP